MLARTERTAEELGIPEAARLALLHVRNMMERGELKPWNKRGEPGPNDFYMKRNDCCYIGHAKRYGAEDFFKDAWQWPLELKLLYNDVDLTFGGALDALNEYLGTGRA
jgi:hypothetical protein